MNRRNLLQNAAILAAAGLIPIGINSWAVKGIAQTNNRKRLIAIFLRGAVDGLNVVVPYQESNYYEARPRIAIPKPGEKDGVLDLDGRFGLHPALADIIPLWEKGSLAFIHACGSPDSTRSHFDAQDYMESGTPGVKTTQDGWLNRLLGILPKDSPVQAVNVGATIPRILTGKMSVANLPSGNNSNNALAIDRPEINGAFSQLYSGKDPISLTYQEGDKAREILLNELNSEMMKASMGAPSPVGFANDTRKLAKLMVGDAKTQLAFMALGGWDTHVNQGSTTGQLGSRLKPLAEGLVTLVKELGPVYSDTVIVVLSEFGRTVAENGNGGTDHGHGNVMWVLGGGIRGGKIYGEWPGLNESELYEKRDLEITTDYRNAIASILTQHIELNVAQLSQLFPNYTANATMALL